MKRITLLLIVAVLVLAPVLMTGASTIRSGARIFIPADDSVDSTKIADGSIIAIDLSTGCVTRAKLSEGAVGAFQIGEDSVTVDKIGPGACDSAAIATDCVDSTHIQALGNEDIPNDRITTRMVATGCIGSTEIEDGSIDSTDIANDGIGCEDYAPGSVDSAAIKWDCIGFEHIEADAVGSGELQNTCITHSHLGGDIIDSTNIADNSLGTEDYAPGSVDHDALGEKVLRYENLDLYERAHLGLFPAGDTLFSDYYNSGSDSGHFLVRVDELGDSLTLVRYCHDAKTGANRGWGGIGAGMLGTAPQLMCTDYEYIAPIRRAGLEQFWNGAGTGRTVAHTDTVKTIDTNECIQYQDSWTYLCAVASDDTCYLEVERTLTLWRNMPGYVIRYKFRSDEPAKDGDTLRFVIAEDPCVGPSGLASYNVGWFPGYGEVRRNHIFDDFPVPVAAMLNIGNVKATADTLGNGATIYMSDTLMADCGSGTDQFVGTWIAFNPNGAKIEQVAFADTAIIWDRLHYDSTLALTGSIDSSSVFDFSPSNYRNFYFRTEPLYLDKVNWVTVEYGVGPVKFLTDTSPVQIDIPRIYWTDGTVTKIDTGLRR